MKNWQKKRKELEQTIAIIGMVAAYERIPKEMPVNEYPEKLAIYHEEQLHIEEMQRIPSYAKIARKARIDELRRKK